MALLPSKAYSVRSAVLSHGRTRTSTTAGTEDIKISNVATIAAKTYNHHQAAEVPTTMQRRHRSRLLAQSPRFATLSGARQLPAGSSRGCRASYLRGPLTTQNFTIHHYLATISLFLQDMCTVYCQHSRVPLPTHASQWST